MMKAVKGLSLFGGLAVVLTLFLVIGCSNKNPVQPLDPESLELGKVFPVLGGGSGPGATIIEEFDSSYINKSVGGTIEIDRTDYSHEFVVPANALEENTLITIRSINEGVLRREMIVFEFGPDGLEFRESARLAFEMAELSQIASTARLYYYDPVLGVWNLQDTADVVDGVVTFDIDHFSKYAISD